MKLVTLDWAGQFKLQRVAVPHGGTGYLRGYLAFMARALRRSLRRGEHALPARAQRRSEPRSSAA